MPRNIYFTVVGSGSFPHDMLRYDQCWPLDSEDAEAMHQEAYTEPKPLRSIVLISNSLNAPTRGRWNSFQWSIHSGIDRRAHIAPVKPKGRPEGS